MVIRPATAADLPAINDIYNYEVLHGLATFDVLPRSLERAQAWLAAHDARHPVLVADRDDSVLGWASLTLYSDRKAYENLAEDSLYVHQDFRGRGIGGQLLDALLAAGKAAGLHSVLARITAVNRQSIEMHRRRGFEQMGVLREAGTKNGRLLDVVFMQLVYPT